MYKRTITYVDYDENERTEDFYFNLSKAEIAKLQLTTPGGWDKYVEKATKSKDGPTIMALFNDLIRMSYGEKSADGKQFVKSEEISTRFMQTPAYDTLFMELLTDSNAASEFFNGILPKIK